MLLPKKKKTFNWNFLWKIWPSWHLPFIFISRPSGAPALLLLESQRCPLKCRMAAPFTLHSDYNDSSSYRGANLSIHLAKKCSTIMTSDPYLFSWKRLLPAGIREWPAGTSFKYCPEKCCACRLQRRPWTAWNIKALRPDEEASHKIMPLSRHRWEDGNC